jgi:hypothetical protein
MRSNSRTAGTPLLYAPQKAKASAVAEALFSVIPRGFSPEDSLLPRTYFTLAKMITSVYKARDSISARPRISAN